MEEQTIDVLALNETRLDSTISNLEIGINNYTIIRRDRTRHGGGVAIYIRSTIEYKIRDDLKDDGLEFLCIEITKPKIKPFLISTWYRPPNSPVELFDKFHVILEKIESLNIESTIVGDLNCNVAANNVDNNTKHLLDLCELYQYSQLIQEPTRITSSSSTLIDLLLTNEPSKFSISGVKHIGISDHSLIYASRKHCDRCRSKPKILENRYYKHFNIENFKRDIDLAAWQSISLVTDPVKAWDLWKSTFLNIADLHAPIKKRRVRKTCAPWLTTEIKHLMWERDRLKQIAVLTNEESAWFNFKNLKNQVNFKIRENKTQYYNSFFNDNLGDSKKTWNGINTILSKNKNLTHTEKVVVDDAIINDPLGVSNAFNRHFTGIGPKLAAKIPVNLNANYDHINKHENEFELLIVSELVVSKLVEKLSTRKANGLDNIPACLLKASAPTTISSLTYIINLVIHTGTVPHDWKRARVTPIHKEDCKMDPNNYRPISVLSVVAKLFEKVIFDQTYEFLCNNNLLSDAQSGFRPLHSTLTALLDITDKWYSNMDNGLINAILFIDLKKAFDTIDHEILLNKLSRYGFKCKTIELFRDYLTGRTQITVVNNIPSDSSEITCGVPQVSILGPLLFLLYINDLPNCNLISDGHLYADDTSLTYADNDINQLLSVMNSDLLSLRNWLNINKLSLNTLKTKCMFIATRHKLATLQSQPTVAIDGNIIERVKKYKCLGLELDECLMWDEHIAQITSKITKIIGVLRRLKSYLPRRILILIYKSLIQPHFDYCSSVWGNLGKGLAQKLQQLQNRAARIINGSHYSVRSHEVLSELNWSNLEERRSQQFKTLMFKTMNKMVPDYLSDKFTSVNLVHNHNLRGSSSKQFVPRPQTEALKKSFTYRGTVLWNSLPVEAINAKSIAEYKSRIA